MTSPKGKALLTAATVLQPELAPIVVELERLPLQWKEAKVAVKTIKGVRVVVVHKPHGLSGHGILVAGAVLVGGYLVLEGAKDLDDIRKLLTPTNPLSSLSGAAGSVGRSIQSAAKGVNSKVVPGVTP
jgi:hypothetical protein